MDEAVWMFSSPWLQRLCLRLCGRVLKAVVVTNNENSERQGSFPSHLQVLLC